MARICPHCGAALPTVNDAYCGQCHECLDEPPRGELITDAEVVEVSARPTPDAAHGERKAGPFVTSIAYALFFVLMGAFVVMMVLSSSCSDHWIPRESDAPDLQRVLPGKLDEAESE